MSDKYALGRRKSIPWVWIDLSELFLMLGHRLAMLVKDQEPGARGALVNAANEYLIRA